MSTHPDGMTALGARLRRMPSHGLGLLASLALLAASLSAFMLGAQTASATETDTTQTSKSQQLVGHPTAKTRAASVNDRIDAPQHRSAPWTPLAVESTAPAIGPQNQPAEPVVLPTSPRLDYDAPTPQGRAPPR